MALKVVLDAAGGDFAPLETVKGAVDAVRLDGLSVILVGPEAQVRAEAGQVFDGGAGPGGRRRP